MSNDFPDLQVNRQGKTEDELGPEASIPADTDALLDWLDARYPEECPRSSDRLVVDFCIRRAGIRELITFLRHCLEIQEDAKTSAELPLE